jgi:aquaporin Z
VIQGTPFAPLAIGTALMVMVYMGGHVSGGHYNPAVSLGVLLRRKMTTGEFGGYVGAQLAGAVLATLAVRQVVGQTFAAAPAPDVSFVSPLLVEVLFTFALVLVVLNVAVSAKTTGNSYYGLAIGFTVMVGAFAGGAISGGAFNPAVGLGPMLVHGLLSGGSFDAAWLYLVGPLVGGALAAVVFGLQEGDAVAVVAAGAAAGAPAGD